MSKKRALYCHDSSRIHRLLPGVHLADNDTANRLLLLLDKSIQSFLPKSLRIPDFQQILGHLKDDFLLKNTGHCH